MALWDDKSYAGMIVTMLALGMAPGAAQAANGTSFFDDFTKIDGQRWFISDGWSNGAFQNCGWSKSEMTVKDGMLNIGFDKGSVAGKQYKCGEIRTKQEFLYGTYEARMTTPRASGLNAAFFTYTGPTMNRPHDEIDYETLTKDPSSVSTTTFVNGKSGDGTPGHGNGQLVPLPQPLDQGFLDMAFVWSPDRLDYYVNKKLVRSITTRTEVPTNPQNIFFSLWGSDTFGDWMGPFTDPGKPLVMQVDWFGYTAPGDHCKFPDSLTCTVDTP